MEIKDQIADTPRWYNFPAASEYVGMSEFKLRNRHRTGTGPAYVKPSHKSVLFEKSALDAWMASWPRYDR